MRVQIALAALLATTAPAFAAQGYTAGPTISTTTGRASQSLAGTFSLSASSQTLSTPTITMDGAKGGVNASSFTAVYGVKATSASITSITATSIAASSVTISAATNTNSFSIVNSAANFERIDFKAFDSSNYNVGITMGNSAIGGPFNRIKFAPGGTVIDWTDWGIASDPLCTNCTLIGNRLGIATSLPATTLDVTGNAQFGSGVGRSTFSTTGGLTMPNNTGISILNSGGNPFSMLNMNGSNQVILQSDSPGDPVYIGQNPDKTITVNSGRVGISTTAPATTLDVTGNAQFGGGVLKSTFNATPSASTYALDMSSGIRVNNGGEIKLGAGSRITWPDGSQSTSAFTTAGTGRLVVSSSVVTTDVNNINTVLGVGAAASTAAFTCSGASNMVVNFVGPIGQDGSGNITHLGIYMDGAVIHSSESSTVGCASLRDPGGGSTLYVTVSCHFSLSCVAGAHNFYWSVARIAGSGTAHAKCDQTACILSVEQPQ